ncbi:MAG: AtpZ/AtpI family protein [Bdellovibrionota bacterium]
MGFAAVSELLACIFSGAIAGYLLDLWLQRTKPWFTVVLTLVGLVVGFVRLYRIYTRDDEKSNGDDTA